MTIFNVDYFTTLDRGYYSPETMAESKKAGTFAGTDFPEGSLTPETTLTGREIGTTMAPDTYPIQELQAKIRQGVAKLEIAFSGAGKSGFNGRGSTPEVLGKKEREEFRELAKLNDVYVSTHATFGKQGLSGLTQNGFSEEEAQKTLKEINKAIEFAASATQGGAVVFHAGEWQRPIMDANVKDIERTPEEQRLFREYGAEWKKAPIYLADERTGEIKAFFNRDSRFYVPEDKFNAKTGLYDAEINKDGTPKVKELNYEQAIAYYKERLAKENPEIIKGKSDAQILLYGQHEQKLKGSLGQALRYSGTLERQREELEQTMKKREMEEKVWNATPESERWKLQEFDPEIGKYKSRKDMLAEKEKKIRMDIEGFQATAVSAQEDYKATIETINRFKPVEEVGIQRTADTLARAGIKAMMETDKHKKELKEAIYIAPENVFPDFYGSNADELIKIVQESRKDMAERLKKQGLNSSDAMKKAETHIRATLDTGHLNNWRQHFKGNDKEFNKWYLDQVQKMVDKKILGHIHLTDNWGYDDEHLTPGQGNTPTRDVVKMLEKAGFKDFITEVGSFNANTILPDTLSELGSPVYALGKSIPMGRFRNGHFGYAAPPNYIVGAYAPSNDFKLWSEVPLE